MKVFSASLRALLLGCALVAGSAQAQKVLKFIPQADLRILDPIATTAYITRNHGYMIYDTLFATDAKFQIQPQMVDKYEMSADKQTYTFTLRDETYSLRLVYVHMIAEYSRHNGHADLLRERIDGTTGD